jgi:hypothetical protein
MERQWLSGRVKEGGGEGGVHIDYTAASTARYRYRLAPKGSSSSSSNSSFRSQPVRGVCPPPLHQSMPLSS